VASLADLVREHLTLTPDATAHLQRLVRSWGLLADLSFSDVLLFAPTSADPDKLVLLGHVRPTTAQTIYRTDLVGELFRSADRPAVTAAFQTRSMRDDIQPLIGVDEVRIKAIPVCYEGTPIAVLTRESLPVLGRSTSDLERTYLAVFERFATMIASGAFPFARDQDEQYRIPRVGDGILVLDANLRVEFNSPNAVSALHRLGVHLNSEGCTLDDLGLDARSIHDAVGTRMSAFEELERGPDTTVVLHCIPLIEDGEVSGALLVIRDISELRRRDRLLISKDATIREIHHRVKNNLQTISSLLRLQSRRLSSEEAKAAVEESVRRIASIAVVHETLAQDVGDEVVLLDVVRPLVRMVQEGLVSPERPIHFSITGDAGVLPAHITTPLAVVVTELLQNIVEHGYPTSVERVGEGRVSIQLARKGDLVTIRMIDDGVGVPATFQLDAGGGLGLTIVRTFIEGDLGGTIVIRPRDDGPGTYVELVVPVPATE
jgi:two-component system, sensor histidine kinase PdtaS